MSYAASSPDYLSLARSSRESCWSRQRPPVFSRSHDPQYERQKTGSTKTTTDYVYVNGRLKFTLVGSNTYYYFTDALGSVRQTWQYGSSSSASFSVQTYKPFGAAVGVGGKGKTICRKPRASSGTALLLAIGSISVA